jgi:hypothetical protein
MIAMRLLQPLVLMFSVCGLCPAADAVRPVFVVPNFHPASCGWLTDWSTERNYCANSYFDHLDRVRDDPSYSFALSECNNLIAMLNFRPERAAELRKRIREGRVELSNAFFLEPTVNLSGGEALVKMGVEGLRWQQRVMGVRPRTSWMIDVTGMHEQMAQIVAGLGLEALVYCRLNPTGSTLHWIQSPDGSRILAISPGHYLEWRPMFGARQPLSEKQLGALADDIRARIEPLPAEQDRKRSDAVDLRSPPRRTPPGAPVLIFGGSGDYSLAPLCPSYPGEFLRQFQQLAPQFDVRFSTPGKYLDAVLPGIASGAIRLPTMRGGWPFNYNAFWIENPRVKAWYRRCEQQLQAAEMLATAASLRGTFEYPVQRLYQAWLEMLLNMDRNTLWGSAGGMVFEHPRSWDARDRFQSVERISGDTLTGAARALAGSASGVAVFNPLNWRRSDSARLASPAGPVCQTLPGQRDVLCRLDLASLSTSDVVAAAATAARPVPLPPVIETRYYRARLGAASGAIESLVLRPSGREMLGGPANVVVAERPKNKGGGSGDHMVDRPQRQRVTDSSQSACRLTVTTGPVATVVEAESAFAGGGRLRRTTIFYHDDPRIDFETELNDLPDGTVVVAEFPLADEVLEVRRGIPYGFSHAAWSKPNPALSGFARGITPAVRWSHYQTAGGGVALLDQGLSGREIVGNTPVIYLYNAAAKYRGYPNSWLSGAGRHVLRYALLAHAGDFTAARIPQRAWEFNAPPLAVAAGGPADPRPILETSENLIVEALRREGGEIELRLAECLGRAGTARLTLNLPHRDAAITDMIGGRRQPLAGGPGYQFPLRPQQIVTLRFRTDASVAPIKPLTQWDDLVPPQKREALRRYLPDVKGHPPAGGQ